MPILAVTARAELRGDDLPRLEIGAIGAMC
jgi:hypothetical protein